MSFFIREANGEVAFGGMKSIELDYEHVTPFGKFKLTVDGGKQYDVANLWIIGSAVKTSYVKALMRSGNGQYDEDRLAIMSGQNDVIILVRVDDHYYLYRNSARTRQPIVDGVYEWLYGTVAGQVNDAINGLAPTRWQVERHTL